jgi:protein SCO1/2
VKIKRDKGGDSLDFLMKLSVCCLLFTVFLCSPRLLSAHTGQSDTEMREDRLVQQEPEEGNQITDQDWIKEKTGGYVPLEVEFTDSTGKSAPLRALINRPTLILPIYFYCPNSCSLNLSYLAAAIKASTFKPGIDFQVIAFSFNADEKIEDAGNAKRNYLKQLPDNFPADAWSFLVGSKESIQAVTDALGYTFKRMPNGIFVHPSALAVLSSEGRVIKYVYGSFLPGDVDMALQEAKEGRPSLSVKRFLNYCFNNDSGKSQAFLQNLKYGVMIGFVVLGGLFLLFLRRSGKKRDQEEEGYK